MDGRPIPSIDDVKAIAPPVLRHRVFTNFKNRGLIDSVRSAMFGRIYTRTYNALLDYKSNDETPVSQLEAAEFGRIFEIRSMEIKSRIMETASL